MSALAAATSCLVGERRGPVLTTERAAEYCGIAVQTLYNLISSDAHRAPGEKAEGPAYFKQGRRNAFYPADLDAWLAARLTPAERVA